MKNLVQTLFVTITLSVLVASCGQTNSNPALVGKWKMNSIEIKQYAERIEQMEGLIKSLNDSLAIITDTAKLAKTKQELVYYQQNLDGMKSNMDSSLKNTFWTFDGNGQLSGQEADRKNYTGYWNYNDKTKMLTRYLPADSVKVAVKGDTMVLNLDSINHITFVKSK
ncbi:MAG: hypothetical protein LH473_01085 [Chitinophagales bacterium]|nr:hypothetical protein [Chitinophagales bacterium]